METRRSAGGRAGAGGTTPAIRLALTLAGFSLFLALVFAAPRVPGLLRLEASSADFRTTLLSDRIAEPHPDIAIVAISDETLAPFAVKSPIDRDLLGKLVQAIDAAQPRAIGLDVFFVRRTEEEKDRTLQAALRNAKAPVVLAALDERVRITPEQRIYHDAFIAATGRRAGYIQLQFDRDGVIRSIAAPASDKRYPDSFPLLLARAVLADAMPQEGRIAWLQQVGKAGWFPRIVNWNGKTPFTMIKAEDVLDPRRADLAPRLKGRIVLIGADFAYVDRHRTPLTIWNGEEAAGISVHAQVIAQLIDRRSIAELSPNRARLVAFALGVIGALLGWRYFRRRFDFLGWSIAAGGLTAIDAFVFSNFRVIVPFMMFMLAWFSAVMAGHNLRHLYEWRLLRYGPRQGLLGSLGASYAGDDPGDVL